MQKNKKNYSFIFSLFILFLSAPGIAQGDEVTGKYINSIVNYIVFDNGQFTRQYTKIDLRQSSLTDQTGEPALERETICVVRGTYTIDSSSVELYYEQDSCDMKEGQQTIEYDTDADIFILDSQQYRREGGPVSESQYQVQSQRDVAQQVLASSDVEAGLKTWQWQVAKAMQNLNNNYSGIWYCGSGSPHLDESYWTWDSTVGSGGWIPSTSANPSTAVNWYFGSVSSYEGCTECLMAARASFYKGLLDTIGPVSFNSWFANKRTDLSISNRSSVPSPLRMNKPIQQESDLDRGDWVYFQNWVSARTCPDINPLQGENAITQASSAPITFIGLGMPGRGGAPETGETILNDLRNAWQNTSCPQSREGQLRKDLVMTASPSYFENIVNTLSLLTSLQPNVTVTDLSGSNGTRQFYKLVIPTNMNSITISSSGGSGNSDLYVMADQWPTEMNYDHRSISAGNDEAVELSGNISGTWYIMLGGADDYTGVSLIASSNVDPPLNPCTQPIMLGVRDNRDRWQESCLSTHRQERYAKYYTFTLSTETRVVVSLESETDTYLYLLDGTGTDGEIIARNDDSNGSYNSEIIKTLPAGNYTIEATTYSQLALGEFNIRLGGNSSPPPPEDDCLASISAGQITNDSWVSTCTSTHSQGRYAKYYTFFLSSEEEVTIDLQSQVDTYLFLLRQAGEDGTVITLNDDSNGSYDSQIVQVLPAGRYTIEATTYSAGRTGDFTVVFNY